MMLHYTEVVHAIKMMHYHYLDSIHNALNHHPTPKGKALRFLADFQVKKILAQSTLSMGRLHNDTCINAFNVSSFNQQLRSLFTQYCLENPRSHIAGLAKPKLQSVPSRSHTVKIVGATGIWKCLLECQDWSPTMFLFANYSHCVL